MASYYPVSSRNRKIVSLASEPTTFTTDTGTVNPVPSISGPTRRNRKTQKISTAEERRNLAIAAVNDPSDNDPNLDDYLAQENGEVHAMYLARYNLMVYQFFPRNIGPGRSESLSKIMLNKIKYGVKYPSTTEDVIDQAFDKPVIPTLIPQVQVENELEEEEFEE